MMDTIMERLYLVRERGCPPAQPALPARPPAATRCQWQRGLWRALHACVFPRARVRRLPRVRACVYLCLSYACGWRVPGVPTLMLTVR